MVLLCIAAIFLAGGMADVQLRRVPDGGIQPQIVKGPSGETHMLYYRGDPAHGDLFYVRSTDDGEHWSKPIQVNTREGDAIAIGSIRGGQIAVDGKNVYVVWNGSAAAESKGMHGMAAAGMPLYFTHLKPDGTFEPERNLLGQTTALDGGSSVAASGGRVYVVWHAFEGKATSEKDRKVWIAVSGDRGASFAPERPIWSEPTGACACCGMKAIASGESVTVAYRSAKEGVDRDVYVLRSSDAGRRFQGQILSKWPINACPMSSFWLEPTTKGLLVGAEEQGEVLFASVDNNNTIRPSLQTKPAKYPAMATNRNGATLCVWTEGMGWDRGGDFAWQAFDSRASDNGLVGRHSGVPKWSFPAVLARKDGGFAIYY